MMQSCHVYVISQQGKFLGKHLVLQLESCCHDREVNQKSCDRKQGHQEEE